MRKLNTREVRRLVKRINNVREKMGRIKRNVYPNNEIYLSPDIMIEKHDNLFLFISVKRFTKFTYTDFIEEEIHPVFRELPSWRRK